MKGNYILTAVFVSLLLISTVKTSQDRLQIDGNLEQLSDTPPIVICIQQDQYNTDQLLVCGQYALHKFNLVTRSYTNIAGLDGTQGYLEGNGLEARFTDIQKVVQVNETTYVVSDHSNDCLRVIHGTSTNRYVGQCQSKGFFDGSFTSARFNAPSGFTLFDNIMYLAEWGNYAIRIVNLVTERVSTLVSGIHNLLQAPAYITCVSTSCEEMYVTIRYGIIKVNRNTGVTSLLAGSLASGNITVGSINETTFKWPEDIVSPVDKAIIVADRDAHRLVIWDTQAGTASSSKYIRYPWGLLVHRSRLFIGSNGWGILAMNISTTTMTTTMTTPMTKTTTPTTIPTTTPTTTTTTTPSTMPTTAPTTMPTTTPITVLTTTATPAPIITSTPTLTTMPITMPRITLGSNANAQSADHKDVSSQGIIIGGIVAACVVVIVVVISVTICYIKTRRNNQPARNDAGECLEPISNAAYEIPLPAAFSYYNPLGDMRGSGIYEEVKED